MIGLSALRSAQRVDRVLGLGVLLVGGGLVVLHRPGMPTHRRVGEAGRIICCNRLAEHSGDSRFKALQPRRLLSCMFADGVFW
jgi:hypothetical protein